MVATAAGRPHRVDWGARPYPPSQIMEPLAVGPRLPDWSPQIPLDHGIRMLLAEAGIDCRADGRTKR